MFTGCVLRGKLQLRTHFLVGAIACPVDAAIGAHPNGGGGHNLVGVGVQLEPEHEVVSANSAAKVRRQRNPYGLASFILTGYRS